MGWNTVAVLYNDQSSEIRRQMPRLGEAMQRFCCRGRDPLAGNFGCGQVVSQDHADGVQVVVVGRNTGRRVTPLDPADDEDLYALAQVLRGHGYTVRGPGQKRGDGPLPWGYAARQNRTEPKRES